MASEWVKLTPMDEKQGTTVLVNLSRATGIWEYNDDGASEEGSTIWCGAGHEDYKFEVRETVNEILHMLNNQHGHKL